MPIKLGDIVLFLLFFLLLALWKPKAKSRMERRTAEEHEPPEVLSEARVVHPAPNADMPATPTPERANAPAEEDQVQTGQPVNVMTRHVLFGDRIVRCQEYRVNGNVETRVRAVGHRGRPTGRVEIKRQPLHTAVDALIKTPA